LPDGFGTGTPGGALTHFDFSSSVPLVPGNVFVIDVVVAAGDNWGIGSCGCLIDTYPPGRQIPFGVPSLSNDLWFTEGPAVPEPSSVVMLGTGVVTLLAYSRPHGKNVGRNKGRRNHARNATPAAAWLEICRCRFSIEYGTLTFSQRRSSM